MAQLKITYIKSSIGYAKDQKATVASLGLRKLHQSVIHEDTPAIRGMIFKVKHLVKVEETDQVRTAQPAAATTAPVAQAAPVAVTPAVESDDLTLIEGVEPAIADVLRNEGVTTFAQFATLSTEELFALLRRNNVGRVADPDTWPEQAQLAAAGRFDELQRVQAELRGGRS